MPEDSVTVTKISSVVFEEVPGLLSFKVCKVALTSVKVPVIEMEFVELLEMTAFPDAVALSSPAISVKTAVTVGL